MTRPGQPEDLDDPQLLWTRAAVLAVAAAADIVTPQGLRVDDDGVFADLSAGGNWWKITLAHNGEAVFSGQDSDGSHTRLGDEPVDVLAGLPERLGSEQLRKDMHKGALGYVYWYTDGAWHRADYPSGLEDDGLEMSLEYVADDDGAIDRLLADQKVDDKTNAKRAVADVLTKAREGKLRPGDVTTMLNTIDSDIGADAKRTRAALEASSRTGLLAGTKPPLIGEPEVADELGIADEPKIADDSGDSDDSEVSDE